MVPFKVKFVDELEGNFAVGGDVDGPEAVFAGGVVFLGDGNLTKTLGKGLFTTLVAHRRGRQTGRVFPDISVI